MFKPTSAFARDAFLEAGAEFDGKTVAGDVETRAVPTTDAYGKVDRKDTSNDLAAGFERGPGGLQYRDLKPGDGETVSKGDTLSANYILNLVKGVGDDEDAEAVERSTA